MSRNPPIPSSFVAKTHSSSRPLSIAELADLANTASDNLPFSPSIPIKRYLSGASTLQRQAGVYRREGDREQEFICLVKCARLVIELLPNQHPGYRELDAETIKRLKKHGQDLLDDISSAKLVCSERYERWNALDQDDKRSLSTSKSKAVQRKASTSSNRLSQDPPSIPFVKPNRNTDTFFKHSSRDMPTTSAFTWSPLEPFKHSHGKRDLSYPALRPQMSHRMSVHQTQQGFAPSSNATARYYQTLNKPESPMIMPKPQPYKAPATIMDQAVQQLSNAPSTTYTEGGSPLRALHVPSELSNTFMLLSSPATEANLETCALLQGKLTRNVFIVSHLLFPRQTATADSCTTQNEEQIMAFQEQHGLITLGWIHTHPTQSCFLSSLDLHTHAGYQMMLPEAVAVVCSPRHDPQFGLFRLTDPEGLKAIVKVRLSSPFFPESH